jgi:hypothetical protein
VLILPVGRRLPRSGLYIPESATRNRDLDWRRRRTIWTIDGEVEVPTKRRRSRGRYQSVLRARVRNFWVKDERGKLLVWDPHGSLNTITGGAGWNILNALFGYIGLSTYGSASVPGAYTNYVSGNYTVAQPAYNDGNYNFPTLTQIGNWYNGTDTYYAGYDAIRPYNSLFGQVWYLHGASGGLTGSHIPATVTPQMGHSNVESEYPSDEYYFYGGWLNGVSALPTYNTISPYTNANDTVSYAASGTPYIEHSITVSTTTSAQSVTFDSVAWVPIVGLGANSGTSANAYGAGSYWAGGSPVTTSITWASGSTTPTSISNLQVSALWVFGFAVTLSPGQSFGYTYTFQG